MNFHTRKWVKPEDLNPNGTLFGGSLLRWIDEEAAIYAIVPDCVEYGEWKTGVRNDGFQYAFVSLGNKLGMAIGTSALAGVLSALSFAPNQVQNAAVQNAMHYAFSLLPGVLWLITAIVLFFYRISKRSYNQIMSELNAKKTG